ncbi:MAG: succinate dehydrogenase, hydrophobic membrane anchor protein [Legionellaceae bacterium]|nr:succinate dehydrogenase, hydrophobic membrane anchor protein [Legionellaceae bacterium]
MVTNITSLTGNGLKDWLIQRVTAVYLLVYTVAILCFLKGHAPLDFVVWQNYFHCIWVKVATIIALSAVLLHAWIGLWTVTTDYMHGLCTRISVQVLVLIFLLAQCVWGFLIVWGQ